MNSIKKTSHLSKRAGIYFVGRKNKNLAHQSRQSAFRANKRSPNSDKKYQRLTNEICFLCSVQFPAEMVKKDVQLHVVEGQGIVTQETNRLP